MRRGTAFISSAVLLAILAPTALALITRLTALSDMLAEATFVVVAVVESIDEKRPAMTLTLGEALKGKPGWKKLPVLLAGDGRARKLKEPPELLKRLQKKQSVVLFVSQRESEYAAFAFTEGTWFSLAGTAVEGEVRWSFTHLEPYLRRTFHGTTKEMVAAAKGALAGKTKPPEPDAKVKPGLGPEGNKSGMARVAAPARAVIPTVLVGGPLAMLAMLFPAAFGGWKRWLALLSAAGTNCTLLSLQWWFADSLVGSWWGTPQALWAGLGAVSVAGVAWAWSRHARSVRLGEAPLLAGRAEFLVLLLASAVGAATLAVCRHLQQPLLSPAWLPVVVLILAVWAGAVYVGWTWLRGARLVPALATEAVVLTGLALATAVFTPALPSGARAGGLEAGPESAAAADLVWSFRLPQKGAISSSPVVAGDRVLIAAAIDSVFRPYGALYCLDRATGAVAWSFDGGKKMKQVFSTPTVAGDKIYIGEGFHQDYDCKVYCLDLRDGRKLWEHQTASHTESTAAVADGRVYVGAGDDGLVCLAADTGAKVWGFPGFHIDAGPAAHSGRVYAGCGVGDVHKTTAIFCLDAATGQPVWRAHTPLPVWGQPAVSNGFVYVGTGNGRLNEPADEPAGEVYCLRQRDGEAAWKKKLPDGVLGRLAVDRDRLYFGCRDGWFYAARRSDGETAWRRDLGSPVVAGPALESCPCCESAGGRVYAASLAGTLACLEAATGRVVWSKDLAERTKVPVELIATPALDVRGGARRLYVGVTLVSAARAGELLCFEERHGD
jgi:outer membrane protein assembly factor BamB